VPANPTTAGAYDSAVAAISLSPTRALRRPRRLDLRAVVGLLLTLVAVGGSVAVWSAAEDTRGVLVAARDLPAGAVLSASDLSIARVRVDDAVYNAAVPASGLDSVVGRQLAEPVHANQVLARAQLSTRAPLTADQRVLAIPVRAEAAAGGQLQPGDAVEVFATNSKKDGVPSVVLPRATVYEVGRDERAATGSVLPGGVGTSQAGPAQWISLVVTQDQALQVIQAQGTGDLAVALVPPAARGQ
jgi:Flp pilus assembly protein CpaB